MPKLVPIGLALLLCLSVLVTCSKKDQPVSEERPSEKEEPVSEERFKTLLTEDDILSLLDEDVALETLFRDVKRAAAGAQPSQIATVDRAFALTFNTQDESRGLIFTLTDFDSRETARENYETVKSRTGPPAFTDMSPPIGDASVSLTRDERGIGSIVMFIAGDKTVSVHTILGAPVEPLVSLTDLERLARSAEERLR